MNWYLRICRKFLNYPPPYDDYDDLAAIIKDLQNLDINIQGLQDQATDPNSTEYDKQSAAFWISSLQEARLELLDVKAQAEAENAEAEVQKVKAEAQKAETEKAEAEK